MLVCSYVCLCEFARLSNWLCSFMCGAVCFTMFVVFMCVSVCLSDLVSA